MNILTFDIEEWFHILDHPATRTEKQWGNFPSRIHSNMERILSVLEAQELKATFFCLGWIAQKYPEVIRQISDAGFEIASHSSTHQLVYEQNRSEFRDDLKRSIQVLEDATGKKVSTYRAPGFSITSSEKWAFEVMAELGIDTDCSIFPASRGHGGFSEFGYAQPCTISYNGIELKEFPINTHRFLGKDIIFSGGGFFRILPYPLIRKMMKSSTYVMTYFHPRDFDPGQPVIADLPLSRKFKCYVGLKNALPKFKTLTQEFEFIDIEQAKSLIDWQQVPKITL